MPPVENKRYTVNNFEFPPVDYPNAIGLAYAEFKDVADGYGDMKSFVCFETGFMAALKFMEQKFSAHNKQSTPCYHLSECALSKGKYCYNGTCHYYE